jgi:hypothetical protein
MNVFLPGDNPWIEKLFIFETVIDEGTKTPYEQLTIDLDSLNHQE